MTDKQSQARNLYFQTDLNKTQIAEITGVPRRTLHYWIRQKNWDARKVNSANMPSLLAENCYHLIARFTEQLLGEDRIMRPVTYKEADTLHKLTLTVNKLKKGATQNESMEMFGLFMEFMDKKAPGMARQIIPFVDEYIASRSDRNTAQYRPAHFNESGLIPRVEKDKDEARLDMDDVMAWSDGDIPEDIQDETPITHPEPLPKETRPAGDGHTNPDEQVKMPAELFDEVGRMIAAYKQKRDDEKLEDYKFMTEMYGPLPDHPNYIKQILASREAA